MKDSYRKQINKQEIIVVTTGYQTVVRFKPVKKALLVPRVITKYVPGNSTIRAKVEPSSC